MNLARIGVALLSFMALARAQTPTVNAGGVVNAASYGVGGVAPGSIISIFGTNLAGQPASAGSIPLPTSLGTVRSITFNGVSAAIYYVSSYQINAQLPWNVLPSGSSSGTVNVVVTTNAGSSAAQSVPVVPALPGIFTASSNGIGQAIATDSVDGAFAAPAGSVRSLARPIAIGRYLIIWCTGLGAVDAPIANGGNTGGKIVNTLLKPVVLIGGVQASLVYSILSPQYVGEYQVAVQVAPGTPTGNAVPLQIQMNGITTADDVTIAVAPAETPPLQSTCTLTSTGCTSINLAATDPYSMAGGFGGYADATIRQDPLTGYLWMAYSWPHTIPGSTANGGTQVLDTHLAYSTDGGHNWVYKTALFQSQPLPNAITGQTDYTAYEVMNILPQVVNGITYWYGVHSVYDVPQGGAGSFVQNYTKRWAIAMSKGTADTGPAGLATATPQYLGQSGDLYPQDWPISVNLSAVDSELSACTQFFEPALVMSGNDLYLFLACTPTDPSGRFYAVFKTSDPQDHAPNWQWTYVPEGPVKFANQSDAESIGRYLGAGATYVTQMDIAPSKQAGKLLAIATAAYDGLPLGGSSGKVSLGCVAAELASIDPPKFVYNSAGQVQVDAVLTSPDSQVGGPGSCTYLPNSATGMILAHRQVPNAPQNGGFFTFLMQSFLFP